MAKYTVAVAGATGYAGGDVYDNIARVFFPVLLSLVRGRTTGRIVAVS